MSEAAAVLPPAEEGAPAIKPAPPMPAPPLADSGPLHLAWRALLLDERAYAAVAARAKPWREGALVLLWVLGIVLLARVVGYGFNWLTTPRLERIEGLLREFITGAPWYAQQVRQTPNFVAQFAQTYFLSWEALRALLGIQTPASVGLHFGITALETLLAWLVYGALAHWSARWLGGTGRWSQNQGALALAYAPLLLTVVEMIPGATLPLSLLFWLMLVGKYQAVKRVHGLSSPYALAAALLPYLLASLLLMAVLLLGAALGLEQLPFFDQAVAAVRSILVDWRLR